MMQWALTGYADTASTSAAWDAIFRHFNGGVGYQPGEKIFIKINLTTSNVARLCGHQLQLDSELVRGLSPGLRSGNRRSSFSRCLISW